MNFFGHAVVAGWIEEHAEHALGSMLPDFEAMLRVPLREVRDARIRRGIELHHRTDEVFHRSPRFAAWSAGALGALSKAGVRRGTARAVAHIASEMFLDGCLAERPGLAEGYLAALEVDVAARLEWEDGGDAYGTLQGRLSLWGAPRDYREPSFVLARLRDALRGRPNLAIHDEDAERVAECLPALQCQVEQDAQELLDELGSALGLRP